MYFTKSDYLLYKQCEKSFFFKKSKQVVVEKKESVFLDKGNNVTEAARALFPKGALVPFDKDIKKMIEKTQSLIKKGETIIYEAAFIYKELVVISDIIKKTGDAWDIYEVKSSTGVKERHLDDITYQGFILGMNVNVASLNIVCINSSYERGDMLEENKLFQVVEVSEKIKEKMQELPRDIKKMREIVKEENVVKDIGVHCNKYQSESFECEYKAHCWSHIPDYSVFNISRIGKKAFDLYNSGAIEIKDVPEDYKLSKTQKFQVDTYKTGKVLLDKKEIKTFLNSWTGALYFLDFETFQQEIPLFKGIRPYQQIPFQYSLHILKDNEMTHYEFLGKEGTDPRRALAEHLIKNIPLNAISVAYNMSFEKMVLKDLGESFPDLKAHLLNISANMVDLMTPFQKKWYYTNEMMGSYSIKYVLPALFPGDESLNYKNLNIQNGSVAMGAYANLHLLPLKEIKKTREDLLAYCKLDTLAMVKIYQALIEL